MSKTLGRVAWRRSLCATRWTPPTASWTSNTVTKTYAFLLCYTYFGIASMYYTYCSVISHAIHKRVMLIADVSLLGARRRRLRQAQCCLRRKTWLENWLLHLTSPSFAPTTSTCCFALTNTTEHWICPLSSPELIYGKHPSSSKSICTGGIAIARHASRCPPTRPPIAPTNWDAGPSRSNVRDKYFKSFKMPHWSRLLNVQSGA